MSEKLNEMDRWLPPKPGSHRRSSSKLPRLLQQPAEHLLPAGIILSGYLRAPKMTSARSNLWRNEQNTCKMHANIMENHEIRTFGSIWTAKTHH